MHVLCECAFRTVYGAGKLVKSSFDGEKVGGGTLLYLVSTE